LPAAWRQTAVCECMCQRVLVTHSLPRCGCWPGGPPWWCQGWLWPRPFSHHGAAMLLVMLARCVRVEPSGDMATQPVSTPGLPATNSASQQHCVPTRACQEAVRGAGRPPALPWKPTPATHARSWCHKTRHARGNSMRQCVTARLLQRRKEEEGTVPRPLTALTVCLRWRVLQLVGWQHVWRLCGLGRGTL
jgi:hypothetical protein